MNETLVVLLSHQPPHLLARTLALWQPLLKATPNSLLLAYGGETTAFSQVDFEPKIFIDHPRLRLKDQQRQQQSWAGVLNATFEFLKLHPRFDFVYLVEYDHIPLVCNLVPRMIERLEAEQADVLSHHLHRIDDTSSPHYLYHSNDPRFHDYFASLSLRSDKRVILSMLGTGSFWKRRTFECVASCNEPFPIYVELYLPTLAHHLGFRVRDIPDQNKFVMHLGNRYGEVKMARKEGAWTLHPVKTLPATITTLT